MALLTVVAPLTTIGCGKLELGDHDWTTLTIGDVKLFIAKETYGDIPVCHARISFEIFLVVTC